jgi:hypothetical protein
MFFDPVITDLVEEGVSMLQYADDTIFMFQDSLEGARNLKFILCIFEQLLCLKINFQKSELYCFGKAKEKMQEYATIFTCAVGNVPFKYLGILMHHSRLCRRDCCVAEEKVEKKLHTWVGKQNSYGGRLILLKSCLSNIPYYMISMFELPKGPESKFNFYMKRFFWQENDDVKNII